VEPLPFAPSARPSIQALRLSVPTLSAVISFAALFVLYTATAAPDLTFWDAPELVAAVRRFGIPHPPGTPLYVTIARAVHLLFDAAGPPRAVTMVSVSAGALTGAATAWLVARWTTQLLPAICAALIAGSMFSVWRNATEAEVYALSLLLSVLLLVVADVARTTAQSGGSVDRCLVALAFVGALAVPLHLSALVMAPAAIALAWPALLLAWRERSPSQCATLISIAGGAALLGLSAMAILPIRAHWNPGLNEGGATSLSAWLDVVRREQYSVAPLWPRRAPLWLQLGNVFEWADWQVARALGPTPIPTVARSSVSMLAASLALVGLRALHRGESRLVGRALLVAALAGTVGVALWLNLLAGPSYGASLLSPDALHEARERDYFFVVGWWSWGVLLAIGAWTVVQQLRRWLSPRAAAVVSPMAMIGIASLPVLLNYRTVDRTLEPESSLPRVFALELLEATPPNGVLLLAGDLDGFPVWYLQLVEQRRLDVTPVIVPLLGAAWYREELLQRARLRIATPDAAGARAAAEGQGRNVSASLLLDRRQRGARGWRFTGVQLAASGPDDDSIDIGLVRRQSARTAPHWLRELGQSADPAARLAQRALGCASRVASTWSIASDGMASALLERVCELP
jgi:hypothetical protein